MLDWILNTHLEILLINTRKCVVFNFYVSCGAFSFVKLNRFLNTNVFFFQNLYDHYITE